MFKTLISLALTMSVCAALLSWMEPKDAPPGALTTEGSPREQALRAIAPNNDSGLFTMDGVEIVVTPEPSATPAVLAAYSKDPYHFIISKLGLIESGSSWRELSRRRSADLTVVVLLGDTQDNGSLPVAQWLGLRALLVVLAEEFNTTDEQPWIRIRPSDSLSMPRMTRELQAWLAHDGLLP